MAYPKEVIEEVKKAIFEETKEMRRLNGIVPVSGRRMKIEMPDRDIEVVYYPAAAENAPLIIGFHGGGYLFGGAAMNDAMWRETGEKLGAAVASVEYRKSPEFQYMDAIEDAYDTLVYFSENAAEYGIDPECISLMGCSAGANLAAVTSIYAMRQGGPAIDKQILMYPMLDGDTDPDSKGEGSLGGPVMYIFNELHSKPEETRDPLVSPVFSKIEDLKGLPAAIVCYAENDNLKHEGFKYSEMLRKAGVDVADMMAYGMPHGYYESGFGKISEEEMRFLGDEVKAKIASGEVAASSQESLAFISEHF